MHVLAQFLGALAERRVFIFCRVEPIPGKTKTNKIPMDPRTGWNSDAQDPTAWLTFAEAATWLAEYNAKPLSPGVNAYGIGIVVSEGNGLFCIDLDDTYKDGQWSPLTFDICGRFPGAYTEVSSSGTGLHVFGRCNVEAIPAHRTRRVGTPMEVYTRGRFILLTGTNAAGSFDIDHTEALQKLIVDYLPEELPQASIEWSDEPNADWRGGGTDEQILERLRNRAGSAAALFGAGISFTDLYDANASELMKHYPSDTGKDWDGSAADMALAGHLLWATGYNCERTLCLMQGSGLKRSKWERDDYLRRTILKAGAGKIIPRPLSVPPPPPPSIPMDENGEIPDGTVIPTGPAKGFDPGRFLSSDDQKNHFDGCVYVEDIHGVLMPNGALLGQRQFDVRFGGHDYQMRADGTKSVTSAWEAFTNSQIVKFPQVTGMVFDPRRQPREIIKRDNFTFINSWVPLNIESVPGDVGRFLTHLYTLYPYGNDADQLLAYFAFMVQYKGVKAQWAPLLQGVEGNGKTFFSFVLQYCLGQKYTHFAKTSEIDNRFNMAFYGKLLVCIEDVKITESKTNIWEALKPMITSTRMEIEGKGLEKVTRDVCFNFIMNSNHKDAIRKTRNDRRIAPYFAAQQHEADLIRSGLTKSYFMNLYNWANMGGYANVLYFLERYQIPDQLNPAAECVRAPLTSSTEQAINFNQGSIEQELLEAVEAGREGFRGGWINSLSFDQLLRELGKAKYVPRSKRGELLELLGYMPHPKIPGGRAKLSDGSKPILYITKKGHRTETDSTYWTRLGAEYMKDQQE